LQILSGTFLPKYLILFKLVFISHYYHESPRGELFLKHSVDSFALDIWAVHTIGLNTFTRGRHDR